MAIDTTDELSYEYLTICIQAFEDAAIKAHTRPAMLALANGSTYSADTVLDAHERSLNRVKDTREKLRPQGNGSSVLGPITLVDEDIDLENLFGGANSPLADYIEQCIGCSLRLKFDWQLKPLDLLGPINGFLDSLNASLDKLLGRIDPWRILQDLCWALDHLKTLCPQDLILILLSLKALIKKYLLQMFSIKLDWTTLIGPLLNALVSALGDLLDNIISLLLAPLDCAVSGMKAANDLIRASESFLSAMRNAGTQVDQFFSNLESGGAANTNLDLEPIFKSAKWNTPDNGGNTDPLAFFNGTSDSNQGFNPGTLSVQTTIGGTSTPEASLGIPTGFILKSDTTVMDALADPNFLNSTWMEKLIIPVQEVITWLRETYEKLKNALSSLQGLVGGGLAVSLDNIGAILFLTDMISVVLLIINLLKSNLDVKDWCSFLQENPQVLQDQMRGLFGAPNTEVRKSKQGDLLLKQGPVIVGVVKTCVNARAGADSELKQWITELDRRRS